jgi:hypothetical protein
VHLVHLVRLVPLACPAGLPDPARRAARARRDDARYECPMRSAGTDRQHLARLSPELREHESVKPLELFFDLVFVVAIAQLSHELDHSLAGFGVFAALFLPVFIAWQGFTFYSDRGRRAVSPRHVRRHARDRGARGADPCTGGL